MRSRGLRVGGAPLLLLLLAASSVSRAAEVPEPRADTLNLILAELRQLRRSVELTALLQVKVQVAAERLRVREPQLRALTDQAGHLERALAANAVDLERSRAELTQVEEKIAQETTPEARRELVAQRSALLEAIGQMSGQEEENQRRAAAVDDSLAAERAELNRLSDVLAELERSLERHVGGAAAVERGQPPR